MAVQCQVAGDDVRVHVTIARGPEYDDSFDLGIKNWEPQGGAFDSSLPDDSSVEIGDSVTLITPLRNAEQITGVNMYVWRGEPGYAQTVPLTIDASGTECTAR